MIRIPPTYCFYPLCNAFVIFFVLFHLFEFHTEVRHTQSIVHTYTKKNLNKIWEGQGINCPLIMIYPREQEVHVVWSPQRTFLILNQGCFLPSKYCGVNFLPQICSLLQLVGGRTELRGIWGSENGDQQAWQHNEGVGQRQYLRNNTDFWLVFDSLKQALPLKTTTLMAASAVVLCIIQWKQA